MLIYTSTLAFCMANREIDNIDLNILETLQSNGRISNVDLARSVHLSPSPCLERVRRLENQGFIEAYAARLNPHKLNLAMTAFVQVTLDRTTAEVFDNFKKALAAIPEVAECHMVAGGFDYLVKLRMGDLQAYRRILGELVELPGVAQTHTYMVIQEVKKDDGLHIS